MKINERIKELRIDRGLSQKKLAAEVKVSLSTPAAWESCTKRFKATYIYRLAKYFNVSADYLLGLDD